MTEPKTAKDAPADLDAIKHEVSKHVFNADHITGAADKAVEYLASTGRLSGVTNEGERECDVCRGCGFTFETQPDCCGKGTIHGCCGEQVPVDVQVPCDNCGGHGVKKL